MSNSSTTSTSTSTAEKKPAYGWKHPSTIRWGKTQSDKTPLGARGSIRGDSRSKNLGRSALVRESKKEQSPNSW